MLAGPDTCLKKPDSPSKIGRRAGQAAARQTRGEDRISCGFGIREPLPVRQGLDPGLGHRNVVVDGEIDRLCELAGTELHQLAGGKRHGRKTHDRRVPAARGDVERVHQPTVHFIGEDDRGC